MSKKLGKIERILELKEVKDFATGVKTGKNTSSFRKFVDIEGEPNYLTSSFSKANLTASRRS